MKMFECTQRQGEGISLDDLGKQLKNVQDMVRDGNTKTTAVQKVVSEDLLAVKHLSLPEIERSLQSYIGPLVEGLLQRYLAPLHDALQSISDAKTVSMKETVREVTIEKGPEAGIALSSAEIASLRTEICSELGDVISKEYGTMVQKLDKLTQVAQERPEISSLSNERSNLSNLSGLSAEITRASSTFDEQQAPNAVLASGASRKVLPTGKTFILPSQSRKGLPSTSVDDTSESDDSDGMDIRKTAESDSRYDHSTSGTPRTSLFSAIYAKEYELVDSMLTGSANPNEVLLDFDHSKLGGNSFKKFTHCALLPAAVSSENIAMVDLLLQYGADVESEYGFLAGGLKVQWSGTTLYMCISKGQLPMIQVLVEAKADIHKPSSTGANLIWQCAYFGKSTVLEYLLELGVDCLAPGQSQDEEGISHTPLMIGSRQGKIHCVKLLLGELSVPNINVKNENGESALDFGVMQTHPEVVTTLIASGAKVHQLKPFGGMMTRAGKSFKLASINTAKAIKECKIRTQAYLRPSKRLQEHLQDLEKSENDLRTLDSILLVGNPVILAAVARGLQSQPEQVSKLRPWEIECFLSTRGGSAKNIFKAMFCKRSIGYWSSEGQKCYITTAFMQKAILLPDGQYAAPLKVAVLQGSYEELQRQTFSRDGLDANTLKFLSKLAPTDGNRWESVMCNVGVYEGLVPDVHDDLCIVKALSDVSLTEEAFLDDLSFQAYLQCTWQKTAKLAKAEAISQAILLVVYMLLVASVHMFDSNHILLVIRSILGIALPVWTFHTVFRAAEFFGYYMQGWAGQYLMDDRNMRDICRSALDLYVFMRLLFYNDTTLEVDMFRVIFAFAVLTKWTKVFSSLLPYRCFGIKLLPFAYAVQKCGPFTCIAILNVFGLAHCWTAYNRGESHLFQSIRLSYRVAVLLDTNFEDDFMNADNKAETSQLDLLTYFGFVLTTFLSSITLMNMYIAQLSHCYDQACGQVMHLFLARRVRCISQFLAVAVVYKTRKLKKKNTVNLSHKHLWYAAPIHNH
jgi:ankyrin repeat protein